MITIVIIVAGCSPLYDWILKKTVFNIGGIDGRDGGDDDDDDDGDDGDDSDDNGSSHSNYQKHELWDNQKKITYLRTSKNPKNFDIQQEGVNMSYKLW